MEWMQTYFCGKSWTIELDFCTIIGNLFHKPAYSFVSDGSIGWQAFGSAIEVFSLTSGHRLAAWCFGALLKEPNTTITCVTEYHYDKTTKLVVATATPSTQSSMLCLLDIKTSRIIKAVELSYKVRRPHSTPPNSPLSYLFISAFIPVILLALF